NSGEQAQRYITYIYVKNELVIGISTNTEEINSELKTSMSSILNAFGEPEEIWIRPIRETIDNQPYYDLAVYYKNKGIVIIFNENAEKNNNFLKICPQQLFTRTSYHIIPLLLLDKTMQLEFTEIESKILGKPGFWNAEEYLPLEKVAINLTNKEFFEIYLQPNTSICFDVNPVR